MSNKPIIGAIRRIATFEIYNRDLIAYVPRKCRGWAYNYNGHALLLFPIGTLADVLARTPDTIRRWSEVGKFPDAIWAPKNRRAGRYYSEGQIRMASAHIRTYCTTKIGKLTNDTDNLSLFFAAVKRDWLDDFKAYGTPNPSHVFDDTTL